MSHEAMSTNPLLNVTPVQPPAPPLVARSYSTLEFTPEVLHGDEDEEVDASRGARRGR